MKNTQSKNVVTLNYRTLKSIGPTEKPQKFADEQGLYLDATACSAKSWRYDYWAEGKRATVTFGMYPEVTLAP